VTTTQITPDVRALFFRYDRDLPLDADERELEMEGGVRRIHFRFTSIHGERVPGHLWIPAGPGPHPMAILQHGAGSRKEDAYISLPAARWARSGYATAAIDAHSHGERSRGEEAARAVWFMPWHRRDHAVQMAVDLMRLLDYLATRPEIDPGRVGFVGFSMGTIMGVPFVGLDQRVKAAVFCIGGARFMAAPAGAGSGAQESQRLVAELIDPAHFAPLIAPRPVLMINGRRDEVVPPAAGQALYDALDEPKEILWFDGGHTDLTGALFKRMWEFLQANV
jgi:dienelactone hydrolase